MPVNRHSALTCARPSAAVHGEAFAQQVAAVLAEERPQHVVLVSNLVPASLVHGGCRRVLEPVSTAPGLAGRALQASGGLDACTMHPRFLGSSFAQCNAKRRFAGAFDRPPIA